MVAISFVATEPTHYGKVTLLFYQERTFLFAHQGLFQLA